MFLWLPTGFGKSLCHEVLPFVFGGKDNSVIIVVSLLGSLIGGPSPM